MSEPIRVLLERGKAKRVVASAFDWPGWDRSAKLEGDALGVLESYRPRFAKVAELAGYSDQFGRQGDLKVVEEVDGIGMTDYYGVSGRAATAEQDPMAEAEFDRKFALLQAAWSTFDETAARVSAELRKGPTWRGKGEGPNHSACERRRDSRICAQSRREGAVGHEGRSEGARAPTASPSPMRSASTTSGVNPPVHGRCSS